MGLTADATCWRVNVGTIAMHRFATRRIHPHLMFGTGFGAGFGSGHGDTDGGGFGDSYQGDGDGGGEFGPFYGGGYAWHSGDGNGYGYW